LHRVYEVVELEVATVGEGVVGLLEDVFGVVEAREEGAAVDKIEFGREFPGVFCVLYLELTI
jgi:hypothetical protein